VRISGSSDDAIFHLTFNEAHIGNPAIRALHGGVIAAFLEFAMQADLHARTRAPVSTVSMAIDYLASSRPEDMIGRVKLLREGRRIAFLEASGWQADNTRLVAAARGAFKLG
jgi:acyl-coenzyme A thioesterase PaaI-like protein